MSNSCPVIAFSPSFRIPKFFAIAFAVSKWSPVIITVFIPAFLHVFTASFTPSLGGSIIPINPTKVKLFSIELLSILFGNSVTSLKATAITLKALCAICSFSFFIFNLSKVFTFMSWLSPISNTSFVHLSNNTSGAPLQIIRYLLPILCIVVIIFLLESNGISFILWKIFSVSFLLHPICKPSSTIAFSVGSPITFSWLFSTVISQSVHKVAIVIINLGFFDFTSTTFILFCVNVPVLSEQITLLLPKVSTAGNFLIMLFLFAILVTPIESIIVTIAGNPSGIAATASPTAVINISMGSIFLMSPIIKIIMQIAKHAIPNIFPTSPNFFWSGVSGASSSIIIFAICPTFVSIPVSVTIAFPVPLTTVLAINAIFFISPNGMSFLHMIFASFRLGSASPVKEDSSIFKLWLSIILQSAGIKFPVSKITISPFTKSSAFISVVFPFLITFVICGVICFKASIDFSAFASWITPINALNITIPIIIIEST